MQTQDPLNFQISRHHDFETGARWRVRRPAENEDQTTTKPNPATLPPKLTTTTSSTLLHRGMLPNSLLVPIILIPRHRRRSVILQRLAGCATDSHGIHTQSPLQFPSHIAISFQRINVTLISSTDGMESRTNTTDASVAYHFVAPGYMGYSLRLAAPSFDA